MTTSDHRHSNDHRGTNNGHRSNNNQTNDAEIDSGIVEKKFYLNLLIFF
jgi:hypothetical protein